MAISAHTGIVIELPITSASVRRIRRDRFGVTGLKGLRLTRRGRVVMWGIALLLSAVFGAVVGGVATADEIVAGVSVQTHAVSAGDTLWEIASQINPGMDNRDVVQEIMGLNGLKDSRVQAGQLLYLPIYSE